LASGSADLDRRQVAPGSWQSGAGADKPEFNFSIDPLAAQIIFNRSDIEIWQVPSSTYSQMLFSMARWKKLADGRLGPI
jgi:inosine-uridine nucleoside N-ribohydrolase